MKDAVISRNAVVYPRTKLGKGTVVEDFAVIGYPPKDKRLAARGAAIEAGALIRSHTIIYAGTKIGKGFQAGHNVLIREATTIGDNVSIGTGSCIEHHVKIGNGVRIHSKVFIPEYTTLEDGVWVGPNATFTNALHPLCPKVKECMKGALVKRGAKIGANATLCPDITVGPHALIGAGSVVVGDVPGASVVCGNPAKTIKKISALTCRYKLIGRPYAL